MKRASLIALAVLAAAAHAFAQGPTKPMPPVKPTVSKPVVAKPPVAASAKSAPSAPAQTPPAGAPPQTASAPAPASGAPQMSLKQIESLIATLTGKKQATGELGEMDTLQLQQAMEKKVQLESMISN